MLNLLLPRIQMQYLDVHTFHHIYRILMLFQLHWFFQSTVLDLKQMLAGLLLI